MGFEKLIASLVEEAEAEKESILRKAEEQAGRIIEEARRESDTFRQGPLNEAKGRLSAEQSKKMHAAKLQASNILRRSRQEVVDNVIKRVYELTEELTRKNGYAECLNSLLKEAVAGLEGGKIIVRKTDIKSVSKIAEKLDGSFEVISEDGMPPGIRVVSEDGLIEIDNTFQVRLDRYLLNNEVEVYKQLFGGKIDA